MLINPGIFNKKIQIYRREIMKDDDGFPLVSEKMMLETWAQISHSTGAELKKSNSDFSEIRTRFFLRTPKTQIQKDWMVKFRGKFYEILGNPNDYNGDGNYLEILTKLVEK